MTQTLELVDSTVERCWEAERQRLRGASLRQLARPNAATSLHQVLSVARQQQAKSWELRAATGLVRGGVRAFTTHFLTLPNRPVSQHWMQHMVVEGVGASGYRVTSYWALRALDAVTDDKTFRSFVSYRDTCVKLNGVWLIKEKLIDPWKSAAPR